jgi:hypothetical protein
MVLETYTKKDLQVTLSILRQAIATGHLVAADVVAVVEAALGDVPLPVRMFKNKRERDPRIKRCTDCGRGWMYPVYLDPEESQGITIIECRMCRYSEVIK